MAFISGYPDVYKKLIVKSLLLTVLLMAAMPLLRGNNIDVTNVSLGERDPVLHQRTITFDVNWENSWRISGGAGNYDAAWVFVKFRTSEGPWHHATLVGTGTVPVGTAVDVTADGVGTFVYRSEVGSGNVSHSGIEVVWDYGSDGLADSEPVMIEVFAIEMVYVPAGAYSLGSGDGTGGQFFTYDMLNPTAFEPYTVESENAITMGTLNGNLFFVDGPTAASLFGTLGADFPKGYAGFYSMKYEVSQQQYVRFLNHQPEANRSLLDLTGLGALCPTLSLFRNTFCYTGSGQATTNHPYLPISYLSTQHMAAYLDWTGLRPMTELEYEKACRGTEAPVAGEFAWGTNQINTDPYEVGNQNGADENVQNADALPDTQGNGLFLLNRLYLGGGLLDGPVRLGAFAASGTRYTRVSSGGSYYGIMELSGNLSEVVVSVNNLAGQSFAGDHGDGELDESSLSDIIGWALGNIGYGTRGGGFSSPLPRHLRVSNREGTVIGYSISELSGFRGVRTYPN